ncbi:Cyclochlorotine biosynthesis O [Lecanosticta acicola]|uniref:Cyclochlorotine biosynthesis O n=1 Tax=Lecanosticta acicola TaxID=111012 RepID=A0AAI9EEV6_9PEZI|nr:Cyclochlorotine biosynthesis O [Lecanosticta acicola]
MKRLGREDIGVRVPGEDAYIGTLNVYHEIHCLKRIHQYMYQDTYFPGIDDKQREMNRLHNEHCIDFLRQSAMCHGDVGLITFEWSPSNRIPVANATTHQCVDWNRLDKWTKQRSLDMLKPGWLVHPTLGLAYPQGEGDNIGAAASP